MDTNVVGYAYLKKDPVCRPLGGKKRKPQKDNGWSLMNSFIKQFKKQGFKYRVDEFKDYIKIQWQEK
jgi:hypothetical protein